MIECRQKAGRKVAVYRLEVTQRCSARVRQEQGESLEPTNLGLHVTNISRVQISADWIDTRKQRKFVSSENKYAYGIVVQSPHMSKSIPPANVILPAIICIYLKR